jgi:inorganic pyrophosphatase
MILLDAPAHVGCLIDVRLVGIIEAKQTQNGNTKTNNRLIGAASHSYDHQGVNSIENISKHLLDQVEHFFVSYNEQRGKKFKVTATGGPKRAVAFLKAGIKAYKKRG